MLCLDKRICGRKEVKDLCGPAAVSVYKRSRKPLLNKREGESARLRREPEYFLYIDVVNALGDGQFSDSALCLSGQVSSP